VRNHHRVGLAWCDNSVGQHEIYCQDFDAMGRPRREAQRVTDNPTWSLIPAITASRDGFALIWNEFLPGNRGIHDLGGRSEIFVQHLTD
jgi:hypothetical protein